MVIKIEKKSSKNGKAYVGLWFENWLVTIDRRAIYKIAPKERIKQMKVGDIISFDVLEVDEEFPLKEVIQCGTFF